MKKILLVNGTLNDVPLVHAAHELGLYVITSGNDPTGEAHKYSDEYCKADYSDKEAILRIATELNVDAICSCGNDLCALSASYAAEKLGLPGHDSYLTSKVFHEKDEFKKITQNLKLSVPKSVSFNNQDSALDYIINATYPLIIKPTDLGGGKGVSVANNYEEAIVSVINAFTASKVKHIVIEQYIVGTQHCFICYIANKKVVFDYSSNDTSYINPYLVWTSSGYPADGYDKVREQIISDVEKIANAVDASDGILTVQYLMCNGQPYYLETMRRCLGNFHFSCISKDINVSFYEWYIASEAGMDCKQYWENVKFTNTTSGFIGIYANKNGLVKDIIIDSDFEKLVFQRYMFHEIGYEITNYLNEKLGNLLFSFKNREQRDYFMQKRHSLVKVVLE